MKLNNCNMLWFTALVVSIVSAPQQAKGELELLADPNTPNTVVISYDPHDGNLSFVGNDLLVTTFELVSEGEIFIPENVNPEATLPPWGCCTAVKLFFINTAGVSGMDLWNVLSPGLSGSDLSEQLTLNGSVFPSGRIPNAGLFIVPEPGSTTLLGIGLLMFMQRRRTLE